MKKRFICLCLCLCLCVAALPAVATEATPESVFGAWNETVYVEIPHYRDADVVAVRYTGPISGSLEGQDLTYLVRDMEDGVRIDIPGLPAGEYEITVETASWIFAETVMVEAQDRSGFAHYGDTEGVGAYDNTGKLKENAIVLYVTEENKDTVTVTSKDGTTVSGIGNILNSRGRKSNAGSLTNSNQDILRKLAADGTPLVVRILGRVTLPGGLSAYNSNDYGGSVGDNGAMARMEGGKNITIEGIGEDAIIDGWGLHFICGGGDYARGWGRSFEVRNISFYNVPEDCVGMEGEQDGSVLNAPVERCWIHHCAFYAPVIANPAESDKAGGDGACDFKRGQYFTNAYCYYSGYHKTNLVGGSDSNLQYHLTYHHNYWKNCESRAPLARQADIHMYNNIFEGQSSYCMSLRANTYIFSEYNLFLNSKKVTDNKQGGVCKSYQNTFVNCSGTGNADLVVVADRNQTVESKNLYANFDTDPNLSYIPSGDYILQENAEEMQAVVLAQAGPQGLSFENSAPDVPDIGDITAKPGNYIHNFTEDGVASEFFAITGNLSTGKGSVVWRDLTLTQCLKMESSTEIRFGAPESGLLMLVFGGTTDAAGKTVKIDGTKHTVSSNGVLELTLQAGWHTITKGDSINLFYMVYSSIGAPDIHTHAYVMEVIKAATCQDVGEAVYTCECGESYHKELPKVAHSYETEVKTPTCTEGGGVVHTCSGCSKSYTDAPTAALGHNYIAEVLAATCTQDEKTVYTCENCGDCYEEITGVALGHRYEREETETATVYTCGACGHSYQNEKIPCAHAYGAWVTVKEATNQQTGLQEKTCGLCGDVVQQTIPVAAETTEPGLGWVWVAIGAAGIAIVAVLLVSKKRKTATSDAN